LKEGFLWGYIKKGARSFGGITESRVACLTIFRQRRIVKTTKNSFTGVA